jgi:hypothetical protein
LRCKSNLVGKLVDITERHNYILVNAELVRKFRSELNWNLEVLEELTNWISMGIREEMSVTGDILVWVNDEKTF